MQKVKLQRLTIRDFKGISKFDLVLVGRSAVITGANGTGKTTLADAYSWLLWGKDSQGSSTFQVKPISPDGKVAHEGVHTVAATLDVDGQPVTLSKTLQERWTRPRGKAKRVLSGHDITYEVDGEKVKATEYAKRIDAILSSETHARILADPLYVASVMPWQERRTLLMDLASEVTTEEVLAANRKLKDLAPMLEGTNMDALRASAKDTAAKLKRQLDEYPARIQEAKRAISVTAKPSKKIQSDIAKIEAQIEAEKERVSKAQAAERSAFMNYSEAKGRASDAHAAAMNSYTAETTRIATELRMHHRSIETVVAEGKALGVAHTCPTCGQDIAVDSEHVAREQERLRAKYRDLLAVVAELEKNRADLKEPEPIDDKAIVKAREAYEKARDAVANLAPVDHSAQLAALRSQLDEAKRSEEGKARADELMDEEGEISEKYEDAERVVALCSLFTQTKVDMLEDSINEHFEVVRWRLFEIQINGNLKETADATVNGVPWLNLNGGGRLRAGLDIINALSRRYALSVPVWLDGAESLTGEIKIDSQLIALEAAEGVDTLTVEAARVKE